MPTQWNKKKVVKTTEPSVCKVTYTNSNWLENKLDFYEQRQQAGYETNDHVQSIKPRIEKNHNRCPLTPICVHFRKLFDTAELISFLRALKECSIDQRYSNIMQHTYDNATTTVQPQKKIKI